MTKRINSKAKGSKTERSATHVLEAWTGFPFTRVPQSGGLRWQGGQNITGDIIPEDMYELEDFPFSIEIKARKEIDFKDLVLPFDSEILKFWAQSVADAKRVKKIPMVLMRKDRMPKGAFFIIIPYHVFFRIKKILNLHNYIIYRRKIVIGYSPEFFKADYDLILDKVWDIKK